MEKDMDDSISALARELAEQIGSSESYRKYSEIKAKIIENSFLTFKIKEFKRAHVEYQLKAMNNEPVAFEEERRVSKLYADLMLDNDAKEYLENESAILAMIARIHKILNERCRIDLSH